MWATSNDGMTRVWRGVLPEIEVKHKGRCVTSEPVGGGQELVSFILLRGLTWVVLTPRGEFDTNNLEKIDGLHWISSNQPLRPLPVELFTREYYRPKLLPRILNGEDLPCVSVLASLNREQPRVEVLGVQPEPRSANRVTVRIKLTSSVSEVQKDSQRRPLQSGGYDIRLYRDGQLVGQYPPSSSVDESRSPTDPSAERSRWRRQHYVLDAGEKVVPFEHIFLPNRKKGSVVFTAYAFNSDRVRSETSRPYRYKYLLTAISHKPRAYIITMGVNANQSGWDLSLAVSSAEDAQRLWIKQFSDQYKVVPVALVSKMDETGVILPNATASKPHLRLVLDILAGRKPTANPEMRKVVDPLGQLQRATPDDIVVLYIASHGYAGFDDRFYIIPFDTGFDRGISEKLLMQCQREPQSSDSCSASEAFLERSISSNDLELWWQGVDAGDMIMVLDSCHSAAVSGQTFRPGPLGDGGFGQLAYDKKMRILAATQVGSTARATNLEGLGHTVLVESLKMAQANFQISISAWLSATERVLPQHVHRLYSRLGDDDLQFPELLDFKEPVLLNFRKATHY